jgi:hypothetical protein
MGGILPYSAGFTILQPAMFLGSVFASFQKWNKKNGALEMTTHLIDKNTQRFHAEHPNEIRGAWRCDHGLEMSTMFHSSDEHRILGAGKSSDEEYKQRPWQRDSETSSG